MYYSDFWKVEDWHILESKTCYLFDENESAFEVVNVQIGILTTYEEGSCNRQIKSQTPITRWLTVKEFRRLKKSLGVIIF
jgi:hypothetical protein